MLKKQVKLLKGPWIPGKVCPAGRRADWLFSLLVGSERQTAARPDQDSCHTSQGCVIVQLWTQQVRVWLKGPFMVTNLSRDIAFQQSEDQLKTHYRGGHSIGLAMMIFDCSASAATCVKCISIRSSDSLVLHLLCIQNVDLNAAEWILNESLKCWYFYSPSLRLLLYHLRLKKVLWPKQSIKLWDSAWNSTKQVTLTPANTLSDCSRWLFLFSLDF